MQGNLTKIAAHGVTWTAISQFSIQGFQFIITVILARLLFPEDFGIVGMAAIFTGFMGTVNELGLSAAIIQRKEITNNHLIASFWASAGMGVIVFIIALIAAPFVADFFKKDIVASIMIVSALSFLIGPFGIVHHSILTKEMSFKKLAKVEITSTFISGIVAIILAFAGFGVWALVFRIVFSALITTILLWVICPWRPSLTFCKQSFKELFSFSAKVTATQFVTYLQHNIDYMIIARMLGASSLGVYTMAYRLVMMPLDKISPIMKRVAFPLFSEIQDDNERLCKGYLKQVGYLSILTFPILSILFVAAPEFMKVVYGDKWLLTILPLQILCIAGLLKSVATTVGSILLPKGRPDIELKWNIAMFIFLTAFIVVGSRYGVIGVASAITIMTILSFPILQWITNRLIGLSAKRYLKALLPAISGSIMIVIVCTAVKYLLNKFVTNNEFVVLVSLVLSGSASYFLVLLTIGRKTFDEMINLIKTRNMK